MSTRCQIVITKPDGSLYPVKIYKHCDGYPEGVMPTLEPFAKAFADGRGNDPEYWVAQCIGAFSRSRENAQYGPGAPGHFTGWGCCTFWHGDIEYLYVVASDGAIRILRPAVPDGWPDDQIPNGREVAWVPDQEEPNNA